MPELLVLVWCDNSCVCSAKHCFSFHNWTKLRLLRHYLSDNCFKIRFWFQDLKIWGEIWDSIALIVTNLFYEFLISFWNREMQTDTIKDLTHNYIFNHHFEYNFGELVNRIWILTMTSINISAFSNFSFFVCLFVFE